MAKRRRQKYLTTDKTLRIMENPSYVSHSAGKIYVSSFKLLYYSFLQCVNMTLFVLLNILYLPKILDISIEQHLL
jgi:hypothetical protein